MSETIFTETREDAETLRWLQLATANEDERPILTGIYVDNDATAAADGFRIHRIKGVPRPLARYRDRIVCIAGSTRLHKTPGRHYDAEIIPGNYPDINSVKPLGELRAVVSLNAQYLRDALEMPMNVDRPIVILKIYGYRDPVVIESWFEPDDPTAMIMQTSATNEWDKALVENQMKAQVAVEALAWVQDTYPDVYSRAMTNVRLARKNALLNARMEAKQKKEGDG